MNLTLTFDLSNTSIAKKTFENIQILFLTNCDAHLDQTLVPSIILIITCKTAAQHFHIHTVLKTKTVMLCLSLLYLQ